MSLPTSGGVWAQVLLSVRAVALNFRDVLNVLGMYPGDPGEPGGDVAGIVAAVGSAVRHLHMCACDCILITTLLLLPQSPRVHAF